MPDTTTPPTWTDTDYLRCIPFSDEEIHARIAHHEASECGGGCLTVGAGRRVLELRAAGHRVGEVAG